MRSLLPDYYCALEAGTGNTAQLQCGCKLHPDHITVVPVLVYTGLPQATCTVASGWIKWASGPLANAVGGAASSTTLSWSNGEQNSQSLQPTPQLKSSCNVPLG
jgi:hypothetical protein